MTLEKAVEANCRKWLKRRLVDEVEGNFCLSRLIPSSEAKTRIRGFERLKPEERNELVATWLHGIESGEYSGTDQATIQRFLLFCHGGHVGTQRPVDHPVESSPANEIAREIWPTGRPAKKVRVRGLGSKLRRRLVPLVGPVMRSEDWYAAIGSEWSHLLELPNGWRILTRVDTGGWWQLRYDQELISPAGPVCGNTGVVPALGFEVDLLSEKDADLAADLVHLFCKMFIEEVPNLIGHEVRANG